ncbi:BatA domain-containing protein [Planctomyces sp. SH-PL14]|uniref:BatA domain-containing protein n=1 Tax=Planctomyces sp. SH-PL14 TaxID=1632864 RepID=UPI00078EC0A5|nr:BatA domain-containing protein [Planctomyces sp. SH-PL14]AMV19867.1 hypothetical protein VT03_18365 [Planctomyces sp. SH-PL14]
MTWLAPYFLNPAIALPALLLVSVPIVIHLINRLRYKTVRFAAMEFLLTSEKRNRRRVFLEQLLLLASRILLVLLIGALIARLIVDPSQLSLFQGAQAHHVVILDDSGSMRDRVGESTAFDEAKGVIRKLLAEGAQRPGTQRFTLIRLSRPAETISGLSERDIDDAFVKDAAGKLENIDCTFGAFPLTPALTAARQRLGEDRATTKHLHILSDFRRHDWAEDKALSTELKDLGGADVSLNLVRVVGESNENLAVSDLAGFVEVAAAKVPVTFGAKVSNFGTREASDVAVGILVDGNRLPATKVIPKIAAGETVDLPFETIFNTAGTHRLQLTLEADPLEQDNIRYLAVRVPDENPVLIIDGTPGAEQGLYLADAIAANRAVTGYAPTIDGPDGLRKLSLDKYHFLYLVNVPSLQPDALAALEDYVRGGGGLAWFLGDLVQPDFYNKTLYAGGAGLFPVPIANSPARMVRDASVVRPDITVSRHPITNVLSGQDNPFIDVVRVNLFYPPAEDVPADLWNHVKPIATLQGGPPLIMEHAFGEGRIVTCLTTAGPLRDPQGMMWNNWASGEGAVSFSVLQLELAKYIARQDLTLPRRTVGEPIAATFSLGQYKEEVEVLTPDDQAIKIKAQVEEGAGATTSSTPTASVTFRDTERPGIYALRLAGSGQPGEERLAAYNVPPQEGQLELASEEILRRQLGDVEATIQAAGSFEWIRSDSPGSEIRRWLLWLLVLIGMAEQALAYRLSYHA